jgi:hypothetical protein
MASRTIQWRCLTLKIPGPVWLGSCVREVPVPELWDCPWRSEWERAASSIVRDTDGKHKHTIDTIAITKTSTIPSMVSAGRKPVSRKPPVFRHKTWTKGTSKVPSVWENLSGSVREPSILRATADALRFSTPDSTPSLSHNRPEVPLSF